MKFLYEVLREVARAYVQEIDAMNLNLETVKLHESMCSRRTRRPLSRFKSRGHVQVDWMTEYFRPKV